MPQTKSIENKSFQFSNQFKELTATQAVRLLHLENKKLREVVNSQKQQLKDTVAKSDSYKRWRDTYKQKANFHKREATKLKKQLSKNN